MFNQNTLVAVVLLLGAAFVVRVLCDPATSAWFLSNSPHQQAFLPEAQASAAAAASAVVEVHWERTSPDLTLGSVINRSGRPLPGFHLELGRAHPSTRDGFYVGEEIYTIPAYFVESRSYANDSGTTVFLEESRGFCLKAWLPVLPEPHLSASWGPINAPVEIVQTGP
jgi:hypothetical protein